MTQEEQDKLAIDNLDLAYSIVHKWIAKGNNIPGMEYEDCLSLARLAAVKASRGFDPGKGIKFTTFLHTCVTNELKMELRHATETIRIPADQQESLDAMMEDSHYSPVTPNFEEDLVELIDVENFPLTTEERIILDMRGYFDQCELETLGFPIWKQDEIRTKARTLYGIKINHKSKSRREQDRDRKREVRANNREEYNEYQKELMRKHREEQKNDNASQCN